jgi:hypothetical protein
VLGVIIDSCSTHITLPLPMSEGTTGVEEEVSGWWWRSVLAVVEVVETRVRSDGHVLPSHQAGRGISFTSQISEGPQGPQGLDSGRNLTFSTVVEAQGQRQIWVSRAAFRTRYHWPVVLIFPPSRQASAEPAQATLGRQAAISIGIRGERRRQATQGQHLISNRLKWTTAGHLRPTTARSRA